MRRGLAATVVLAAALVAVEQRPASADHPHEDCSRGSDLPCWFPSVWVENSITFSITASVPANSPYPFRDRIRDTLANWPYTETQRPSITFTETGLNWPHYPCTGYAQGANGIHYRPVDGRGGKLAETCRHGPFSGGRMVNAQIQMDSAEAWYPFNELTWFDSGHADFESVITHELGHALGWAGHYVVGDVCHTGPTFSDQTMCEQLDYGWAYWRSTEAHDRSTMADAY